MKDYVQSCKLEMLYLCDDLYQTTHAFIIRWDTAGADRFKGVTTAYFRGAHGKSST